MTSATALDDSLLVGMSPPLADMFRRWYPYCRASTLAMVDRVGERGFLADLLGQELSDRQYEVLRAAWLEPFRSYNVRGGKWLRPFLACVCIEAHGGDPTTVPGMIALTEIINAASLVLDDIVDDSPLRRGGPTAHRTVGVNVASAVGSAWLNVCFEILSREDLGIGREAADQLMDRIAWEHWVTGIGTTIDTTWPWLGRFDHEPEQYLQSVAHRTGSYTFRLPFRIGAVVGRATADQCRQWEALGEEMGLAFQILNDLMDARRRDERWGKALAEDLTQGKVNLQVLLGLRRAAPADRDRLISILTRRTHDPELLTEAVSIMVRTGALDAAGEVATHHIRLARELLDGMDFVAEKYRTLMHDFIDYVVKRTT